MFSRSLGLTALALALSTGAHAQLSSQLGNDGRRLPINIEANQLEVLDRERKAVYDGRVDASQGESRLRTDRLEIIFASAEAPEDDEQTSIAGRFGDVERLVASGNVFYITPNEKARGDQAVYDYDSDTITLTGEVTVTRGDNVIVGDTLVINVAEGRSTMNPGNSQENADQGRVRTVIVPNESSSSE